jgi:Mrp family chromosome partitioning ATPase
MKKVLSELGDRFDLVLIDSPPIAHLADGLVLASLSDAAVVIARSKVTSQRDLQKAVAALRPTGTYVAGLVMFEPVDVDDSYYAAGLESRTVVLDAAESR